MSEQRYHSEQGADEPSTPGSEVQQRPGTTAAQPQHTQQPEQPAQFDEQQLRQFQEFQQFQRFQEMQRQQGTDVTAGPPQQQPPAKIKVPKALRWLGKKLLAWLIFAVLTILALTWAYNYFLGTEDTDIPAAKSGGAQMKRTQLLATDPFAAVRSVYDSIARPGGQPKFACGSFSADAAQEFAQHMGFPDCPTAVRELSDRVQDEDHYGQSIEPPPGQHPHSPMVIKSCRFDITGGPALGTFVVTKLEKSTGGQWLITAHRQAPTKCSPHPPTGTSPTR